MGLIQQIEGNVVSKLVNSSGTLGSVVREATATALSLALPNDIEAYSITLQLVKGSNRDSSIQSFTFPVMPESLMMAQRYLMTVTTTLGGNYVDDFGRAPSPIQLSGTFGKKVRGSGVSGSLSSWSGVRELASTAADGLTTGYGMAKRLSDMVEQSHTIQDDKQIPKLFLFNWAFNSHWEVVVDGLDIRMDVGNNGLWFYQLNLRTLQKADRTLRDRVDGIVAGAIQRVVTGAVDSNVANLVVGAAIGKVVSSGVVSRALGRIGL